MFTAFLGFTNSAVSAVSDFMTAHANDAYLQAAYAGHIVATLSLHQYFS
jgi:hypothetical protein